MRRTYSGHVAVDGIDFEIQEGECFGFLGPNGAGKSTTMRMLSCLTPRDAGDLLVLGIDPARNPRALKRRLGVVAQDVNLDLELTVRENLLIYGRYFDLSREEATRRADRLLAFVELGDRSRSEVRQLSGGMQRRLQIARSLINDPSLVLLDEPTTGLDPHARQLVWERLRSLRADGVALALTTHYMDEAAQLCDRLVIMDRGRVIREGTPAGLIEAVVGSDAVEVTMDGDSRALESVRRARLRHHVRADRLIAFGENASEIEAIIRATGAVPSLLVARRSSLEDVFLELTGHALDD